MNYNSWHDTNSERPGPTDVGNRLIVSSTDVSEDLRLITEMPNLCDVEFLVGEDREPVYGVKAVLATRSRYVFLLIAVCFQTLEYLCLHLLFTYSGNGENAHFQ